MESVFVWWLSELESMGALSMMVKVVWDGGVYPVYLREQLLSRMGCSGRRCLWADGSFPPVVIREDHPGWVTIGEDVGGILVWGRDVRFLRGWPGLVTDLELVPVNWE